MDLITVRRLQPIWSAMVWWEGQAWRVSLSAKETRML
jgi:hypothetical protein